MTQPTTMPKAARTLAMNAKRNLSSSGSQKIEALLADCPLYLSAPPALRAEMQSHGRPECHPKGTFLFHQGLLSEKVFLIRSGSLRVFKTSASGREMTMFHLSGGEECLCVLNTVACLYGEPCPASAITDTDLEAVVFPAHRVRGWLRRYECVQDMLLKTLSHRLAGIMDLTESLAFLNTRQRLEDLLLRLFTGASQQPASIRVTHEALAAELGTAREVVSRLLKHFEQEGAIVQNRGRIQLPGDSRFLKATVTKSQTP